MRTTIIFFTLVGVLLATVSSPSHAYIGPGMGGGVIVAVLGILGAFFVGLIGIVYFPIKRMLKNKAKKKREAQAAAEDSSTENDQGTQVNNSADDSE